MDEPALCEALNELKGKYYTRLDILDIMKYGCKGDKAEKIAFVLGLPRNKFLKFARKSPEEIEKMREIKRRMFRVDVVGHINIDESQDDTGGEIYYKGVSKLKSGFMAQIHMNGRTQRIPGLFDTREEAALAWNEVAAPLGRKLNEVSV